MRILALDLGTKTLGLAITDRSNTIAVPLKTINFKFEDYESLLPIIKEVIDENEVDKVVLGLPKNMDNSLGFAANRSIEFKKILDEYLNIDTILIDERLTSVYANNILIDQDMRREKRKEVIDSMAAVLILESYLKERDN